MTPSESIIKRTATPTTVTDESGRRLSVRSLSALDTLRLFKAAGPVLSENQAWMSMAMLAVAVVGIDDVPVPPPATEAQIEALVARLDDVGLAAVALAFQADGVVNTDVPNCSLGN